MNPTVGCIVHYRLTNEQAKFTNARRDDARVNFSRMREERPGFQAHVGNNVSEGATVPLMVVCVWANEYPDNDSRSKDGVNGQAVLDGNDTLWVTSAKEGDGPGTWSWPPRDGA